MWHLKKIPRMLHAYWGGGKLPYLRYLTIASFKYYNPDWNIIVYTPAVEQGEITWETSEQKYNNNYIDCFNKLKDLDITIQEVNFGEGKNKDKISAVHQSDYLRWQLLSTIGGLWVDMDILFIKPMDRLSFNALENGNVNTVISISSYGHSIGFLMGSTGNDYFKALHKHSITNYDANEYQCMGSLLCKKIAPTLNAARIGGTVLYNLPMDTVYTHDANHVHELFDTQHASKITHNTIGLHWYGGNEVAGRFLNMTNGGLYSIGDSLIDRYIKEIRSKIEYKGNIMSRSISIVMAYYNRQALLDKTLESLDKSKVKDYELIITDDASAEPLVCSRAKIIKVKREDKWYNCSTVAWNMALREATGDIIIIQNPECYHVGDILAYVQENIRPNLYLSFGCYAINANETSDFHNGIMPKINDYVITNVTRNGWYNHTKHRPVAYHFCSAILRQDLDKVGGFDERYAHGVAYDDDDFIRRVRYLGMDVKIVNKPHTIHQFHTHFEFESPSVWRAPHALNKSIYEQGFKADVCMDYSRNTDFFAGEGGDWDIIKANYEKFYVNHKGNKKPVIPTNLHMIWLGSEVPAKNIRLIETWKKYHPDWNFKIWTDKDVEELDMINRTAYDNISNLGIKSTILRYDILYHYGGVYADMDFECFKSFDDLLYLDFFAGGRDSRPLVAEGLMGCKQGSPFMKKVIDGIAVKQGKLGYSIADNLKNISWEYLTKTFLEYIKITNEKMVLFPDAFFYPMPNSFREEIRGDTLADRSRVHSYIKPNTYCIHLWYASWVPVKPPPIKRMPTINRKSTVKIFPDGRRKIIRPKLTRAQRIKRDIERRSRGK